MSINGENNTESQGDEDSSEPCEGEATTSDRPPGQGKSYQINDSPEDSGDNA